MARTYLGDTEIVPLVVNDPVWESKADVDLGNLSESGKKVIDGQWVKTYVNVVENLAYPSTDDVPIYLSSALPNDNNCYEIMLTYYVSADVGIDKPVRFSIYSSIMDTTDLIAARQLTSSKVDIRMANVILVGTDHKVTLRNWSDGSANKIVCTLRVTAYRRVGTNN